MGKPPSGLLNGDLKWLGSYDECFAVEASVNVSGEMTTPYKGQYCSATFKMGSERPVYFLTYDYLNAYIETADKKLISGKPRG